MLRHGVDPRPRARDHQGGIDVHRRWYEGGRRGARAPTSASASLSWWRSRSQAPRRCSRRRSTRSRTPATRCCCSLAASAPSGKRDAEHPFGYSRYRYFYAFLVAVVLFSLGGLFALYEAWHKFQHPEPIESWQWVPIVVLLGVARSRGLLVPHSGRGVQQGARHASLAGVHPPVSLARAARDPARGPGALLGLVFALFGVSMTLITENGLGTRRAPQ